MAFSYSLRVKKNFKLYEQNVWHVKKFFTCHLLITANAALVGGEEMVVKVEKQVPQASTVPPVAGELDFCFDFCFCGWLWSGRCAGKKKIGDSLKMTTWVTPIVIIYANVKKKN